MQLKRFCLIFWYSSSYSSYLLCFLEKSPVIGAGLKKLFCWIKLLFLVEKFTALILLLLKFSKELSCWYSSSLFAVKLKLSSASLYSPDWCIFLLLVKSNPKLSTLRLVLSLMFSFNLSLYFFSSFSSLLSINSLILLIVFKHSSSYYDPSSSFNWIRRWEIYAILLSNYRS